MKINSKILAITAAFLLFCTLHGAESEYGKNMQSYSCMMRIAKIIAEGEGVFRIDSYSLVYEKGKPAWDTDIETLLGDAKKNKINSQYRFCKCAYGRRIPRILCQQGRHSGIHKKRCAACCTL